MPVAGTPSPSPDPDGGPDELAAALTREHRDIDAGIEAFMAALDHGEVRREPALVAMAALRRHIYLEEVLVFPPLRAAGMVMPIMVMLREHGQIWRAMDSLTDLLEGLAADGPGSADHQADHRADHRADHQVLDRCRDLLALLDQHNTKEEPVIYPQVHTALTPQAGAELAGLLRSGRLPEGWVCQEAAL